jgi:hypothetical protein
LNQLRNELGLNAFGCLGFVNDRNRFLTYFYATVYLTHRRALFVDWCFVFVFQILILVLTDLEGSFGLPQVKFGHLRVLYCFAMMNTHLLLIMIW